MLNGIMDKGEIVREYRLAADAKKELGVLADLNGCSKAEIAEILIGAGEAVDRRWYRKMKKERDENTSSAPAGHLPLEGKACEDEGPLQPPEGGSFPRGDAKGERDAEDAVPYAEDAEGREEYITVGKLMELLGGLPADLPVTVCGKPAVTLYHNRAYQAGSGWAETVELVYEL